MADGFDQRLCVVLDDSSATSTSSKKPGRSRCRALRPGPRSTRPGGARRCRRTRRLRGQPHYRLNYARESELWQAESGVLNESQSEQPKNRILKG